MVLNTQPGVEFAEERRARILSFVNERGRIKVSELAVLLSVTEPTVRRDITELERARKLRRTHGGALAIRPFYEAEVATRIGSNADAKSRIARACVELMTDSDSVFLDAGTTTLAIADRLVQLQSASSAKVEHRVPQNLNVITNSVRVGQVLADVGNIRHAVLGGQYRPIAGSLVGPLALDAARQFTVNLAFIGVTGISSEYFFVADLGEAELKRSIMAQARRTVVAMDSSKIGQSDFVSLARADQVNTIVTDVAAPYLVDLCQEKGIDLIVAP